MDISNDTPLELNDINCEKTWKLSEGNILIARYENGRRPVVIIGNPSKYWETITIECNGFTEFLEEGLDEIKKAFENEKSSRIEIVSEYYEDTYFSLLNFHLYNDHWGGGYGLKIYFSDCSDCYEGSCESQSKAFLRLESVKKIHRYRKSIFKYLHFLEMNMKQITP